MKNRIYGAHGGSLKHFDVKTILAAIHGEKEAVEDVLQKYDAYITELATFQVTDSNGYKHVIVSDDAKQEIRERLISELPKIRGIHK